MIEELNEDRHSSTLMIVAEPEGGGGGGGGSTGGGSTAQGGCPPPENGECTCQPWPTKDLPSGIRQLLDKLEDIVREARDNPTDAHKQLAKDIQECEKEYKALPDLIKKYAEFYTQFDCIIAGASSQKKDVEEWAKGIDTAFPGARAKINTIWTTRYEKKEQELECAWIDAKNAYDLRQDCLKQAQAKEAEAKADLDTVKGFQKSVESRFTDLKSLHGEASGFKDSEQYKAVLALQLQFQQVWSTLAELALWADRKLRCQGTPYPASDLKARTEEWFRKKLLETLGALIHAKYQRFKWQERWLEIAKDPADANEQLAAFRENWRERFIEEAEEVEKDSSSGTTRAA